MRSTLFILALSFGLTSVSAAPSGPLGDSWESIAMLPDISGPWEYISQSREARAVPQLTPKYAVIMAELNEIYSRESRDVPSNTKLCIPTGPMMTAPFVLYEFLLTPGLITVTPDNNEVRRIYTDGRSHPENPELSFNGHSIGHWENDTLVVDTVGLRPESEFYHAFRSGEGNATVRIIERFQLSGDGSLRDEVTMTSPVVFTAPYSYVLNYKRSPWPMREQVCAQNNLAVDPFSGGQIFPDEPGDSVTVLPR